MSNSPGLVAQLGTLLAARGKFDYGPALLGCAVVTTVAMLLVPLSPTVMDMCLSLSIALSLILILMTVFIGTPVELSVFPTVLLGVTIFRLALNVASTRLVLAEGYRGAGSAGKVIEAFGHFVMQGNVIIGLIIFTVLLIVNFVVITKGSTRIAEVAARFTLDALPGKQMAIDADLSAGMVDEAGARARRRLLEEESNFYAAMDGASKFVKGDAIAGVVIVLINIVGGFLIGVMQRGLTVAQAFETYTLLSVGDGLAAQIPALLVSAASGIIITKAGASESTDKLIVRQFKAQPGVFLVAALVMTVIAMTPGLPFAPFLAVAVATGSLFWILNKRAGASAGPRGPEPPAGAPGTARLPSPAGAPANADAEHLMQNELRSDAIRIEFGYALLALVNEQSGDGFVAGIRSTRRALAREFGLIIPSVKIQDNLDLDDNSYAIFVNESPVARGSIKPGALLVIAADGAPIPLPGEDTIEPAFGIPARWVDAAQRRRAEQLGLTIVEAAGVVITHLGEIIKLHLPSLLTYAAVEDLIEHLPEEQQRVAKAVVPAVCSVTTLLAVLRGLLRDRLPLRNLAEIIEAVAEWAPRSKDTAELGENVRFQLRRLISYRFIDPDARRVNAVIYAGPKAKPEQPADGPARGLDAQDMLRLMSDIEGLTKKAGIPSNLVLVVPDRMRAQLADVIRRQGKSLPVLAQREIDETVRVNIVARL